MMNKRLTLRKQFIDDVATMWPDVLARSVKEIGWPNQIRHISLEAVSSTA
jgi:hypothetical protein